MILAPLCAVSLIVVSITLWIKYKKTYTHWTKLGLKQRTTPWPLLGDFWPLCLGRMNLMELMDYFYYLNPESRYEAIYHLSYPAILLKDPDLIKQLAVKDFDYFTDRVNIAPSEEADGLWSNNLVALKGKKWHDMKLLLSGAFTSSKMRFLYQIISETSEDFVKHFLDKPEALIEVDLKEAFRMFSSDVIATSAFGVKVDSIENPHNEFFEMGKAATNFQGFLTVIKFFLLFLFPWLFRKLKIGFFPQKVITFFTNLIQDTVATREELNIVRPDVLQLLLEVKNGPRTELNVEKDRQFISSRLRMKEHSITNQDIVSHAFAFLLAGYETVSSTLSFTCHELAVNAHVQDKLRKEINETLDKCDGSITYEALLGMKYLGMVLSESLRKWPVIPVLDRVCVQQYTIPATRKEPAVSLNAGDRILISSRSIHHDVQYYAEPNKFDPDRFEENVINPFTYMPFGVGPRSCIGNRFAFLEIKLVLCDLLRNFEIVSVEKTQIPLKFAKRSMAVDVEKGFIVGLKRVKN
uniref:Cytochrome P450 CYP9AP1 n=1 Tax=Dendroctonus ponderosae TaxID=77166 RepID=I1VJ60_DENPD|nr:cytochrome P450 CYP9AP1 [Dendroctonus ponderosae]